MGLSRCFQRDSDIGERKFLALSSHAAHARALSPINPALGADAAKRTMRIKTAGPHGLRASAIKCNGIEHLQCSFQRDITVIHEGAVFFKFVREDRDFVTVTAKGISRIRR